MAINKKLIHFNTFENFNSKKLSANIENTQYTLGVDGEIQSGSPDILYQSIVYIKDTKQQWTHGLLYNENNLIVPITYNELVVLRNNNQLIPGIQYRITDYVTTCNDKGCGYNINIVTSSAEHPFDIIIQADSENTLNENAKAIVHEGDTYFQNCNLESWELKYSLDNNTVIYHWADSENGKGVIYYMKDEYNNEAYYDFHNILYTFTSLQISNIELNVPYYTFPGENGNDIIVSNIFYRNYNNIIKPGENRNNTTVMFLPAVILKNSKNNYVDLSQIIYIDGTDNYLKDCTNVCVIGTFNKIFSKTGYFSLSGEYNTIKSLIWNSELIPTQHFLQIIINSTSSYFSLYIDISNYGGLEYFKRIANGRISKIERMSDGVYTELIDGVWQGDLSTIERNAVYKVTNGSGSSFEMYLKGDLINELEYSYYINPGDGTNAGITYFGMPGNQSIPLDDLKALLISYGGGQIRDLKSNYYISYNSTYGVWLGDSDKLTSLNPDHIYKITINKSNTEGFTITLPTVDKSLLKTYNTTIDCYLYSESVEIISGSINSPQYITKDSDGKIIVYNDGDVINQISNIESNAKTYTDEQIELYHSTTLTIDLVSGYNWVSFYVNITLQELQTALGTNGISIETTSVGGTSETDLINTYSNGTWAGNITELDFSKMYMINVTEAATIEVSGELLNPKDITITLNPGWNLVSYPLNEPALINEALAKLKPTEGDQIKFRGNTFVEYFIGEWYPEGFVFMPGEGYMYKSDAAEPITFTYPTELDIALSKKQDKLVSGTNIKTVNGTSILGSGDITIESGSTVYPQVNHGTSDTTFALTPNVLHAWDEVTELSLTLADPTDTTVANEYVFQFTSGSESTTLILPDNIKFNSDFVIEENKIYQISILNGLGTVMSWDNLTKIRITFYVNDVSYNTYSNTTWLDFISSEDNPPLYQETMFKVNHENNPAYAWAVFSEDDYEYAAIQHSDTLANAILAEYILPKHYIAG